MALADYLAARRAEIEGQMRALKAELGEIRIAEDALAGASGRTVVSSPKGPSVVRAGSIKDWVLKVLALFPDGLETEGVIDAIIDAGGPGIIRNSMTPQLSRLKSVGLIEQADRFWRLPSKTEPQDDEPEQEPASNAEAQEADLIG